MGEIINVFFSTLKGKKYSAQLKDEFTPDDIQKIVTNIMGNGTYRLVTHGEEIQDNNIKQFTELKKKIKNGTIIYVCQRMDGGSGAIDINSHRATIIVDISNELDKIKIELSNVECVICTEEKLCIQICCNTFICKECFPNYFIHYNYTLPCFICDKIVSLENIFVTREFILSIHRLEETTLMLRNIDFQICTCGAYDINSTMYAKQQCNNCKRWLCFFCNSDWDETEKKMKNEKYTSKVNCFWETKITYQLLKLEFNNKIEVPSRRCCPKCLECGSYDNKCKYHTCKCGYVFCFICLKSKEDCEREYNSEYNRPCSNIAKQTFVIFPRIAHERQIQHEQEPQSQAGSSCVIL